MDTIIKLRNRLECKINYTLPALLPNKLNTMEQGPVTPGESTWNKRAIPALAIIQGIAAIGGMMIKGINALVDAKRTSSFINAIKLVNENVQITHDRLITLENRTAMMAKAIIPVLKDFKQQINNTNDRLTRQYRMMTRAHKRYNRLFRQTHKTFQIHHLALLMFKDYITILVGTLQRIQRQYVRYKSALDDTLIGIEHLNSGYLMHRILDPKILARYLEAIEDNLEETAPEFEPVFTNVYQYYSNSLISFTNTIDDLLLQLPILIKLKVQVYYDQGSDVKAKQCKTIVTFDTIPESKILDASYLLILSNLQKPWTIACKDISRVFKIEYSTYRILNRLELCECLLTAGNVMNFYHGFCSPIWYRLYFNKLSPKVFNLLVELFVHLLILTRQHLYSYQ